MVHFLVDFPALALLLLSPHSVTAAVPGWPFLAALL